MNFISHCDTMEPHHSQRHVPLGDFISLCDIYFQKNCSSARSNAIFERSETMGFLEYLSATSFTGAGLFLVGFVSAIYLNIKVYRFDR
ncbi:hypothetical protein SAMN05421736_111101 [Evansella caseinilytica]|uniref:Uncharacterized protein n=1 Tax=Evansella caseinilytica TaxID=1503961 RepID=A0A1H3SL95_9BACI|nr:hypothetical protein SAMN05421736_111101 [Evansella caseinilytica]